MRTRQRSNVLQVKLDETTTTGSGIENGNGKRKCALENGTKKNISNETVDENPQQKSPRHSSDNETTTSSAGTSSEIVEMLYGRDSEIATIESKLQKCISSSSSISIYISGPPGTGKTASVNAVLRKLSTKHRLISIKINCVSTNTDTALLRAIYDRLPHSCRSAATAAAAAASSAKKLRDQVETSLQNVDCPVMLILDEIDYIQPKKRSILYRAFQWPSCCHSLAVIAISNSLDLTERELPKLKLAIPPIVLSFAPYSKEDLLQILKNKLSSKSGIDGRAIELCSRKVAAMTGDVRHAMQIVQQMLSDVNSSSSYDTRSKPKSRDDNSRESQQRNSCPLVLGAITNVYRSSLDRARIPLQQKVLLATMLRLADKHKTTTLEKDSLLSAYEEVCNILSFPLTDREDANTALSLLESLSVLKTNAHKCQLLVDVPTAIAFIADSSLITQINNLALC